MTRTLDVQANELARAAYWRKTSERSFISPRERAKMRDLCRRLVANARRLRTEDRP